MINKISLGAVVLAAGKGSRMKAFKINKVVFPLAEKPMILYTIQLLKNLGIKTIVVVVGFAKQSVMSILKDEVIFSYQRRRLGTAHAVSCALNKLPEGIDNLLVLNGDDSAFYNKVIIQKLINAHFLSKAVLTFLTIDKDDPGGLGRVVRDQDGKLLAIAEEKDASKEQKKITEINPACYMFTKRFLKKYLKKIKKSNTTGEYYLTSLISLGIAGNERIETLRAGKLLWRGVNTRDELREAEKLYLSFAK